MAINLKKSSELNKAGSTHSRVSKDCKVVLTIFLDGVTKGNVAKKLNKDELHKIHTSVYADFIDGVDSKILKPRGWYGAPNDHEDREASICFKKTTIGEEAVRSMISPDYVPDKFDNPKSKKYWVKKTELERLEWHLLQIADGNTCKYEFIE